MVVFSMRKDPARAAHTPLLSWREDLCLKWSSLHAEHYPRISVYFCCASNVGENLLSSVPQGDKCRAALDEIWRCLPTLRDPASE